MIIIIPAIKAFVLAEQEFSAFDFPRWQSMLVITLIAVLTGLDPNLQKSLPMLPPWLTMVTAFVSVWAYFLAALKLLGWWLKRGSRWDGRGDLFNLLAASWLVADILHAGLIALGVPALLALPLFLYSIWVTANALSSAAAQASLGYSIGGIVLSIVLGFVLFFLLFFAIAMAAVKLGLGTLPMPVGP